MEAAEHSLFTGKALLTHGGNSDTGDGQVSMPKAPLLREKRARSTIDLVTLGLATLSIIYEAGIRGTTVFDSRNRFQITVIGN